jgi:hypothetical protein
MSLCLIGMNLQMNDFTKEELEYIYNYIFNGAACISFGSHEIIKNKLQSMIDNYCEHEETYYSSGDNLVCSHCHKPAWGTE